MRNKLRLPEMFQRKPPESSDIEILQSRPGIMQVGLRAGDSVHLPLELVANAQNSPEKEPIVVLDCSS